MILYRLAIAPVRDPSKRPRMSPPHAQIEELENVRYLVESVSINNLMGFCSYHIWCTERNFVVCKLLHSYRCVANLKSFLKEHDEIA